MSKIKKNMLKRRFSFDQFDKYLKKYRGNDSKAGWQFLKDHALLKYFSKKSNSSLNNTAIQEFLYWFEMQSLDEYKPDLTFEDRLDTLTTLQSESSETFTNLYKILEKELEYKSKESKEEKDMEEGNVFFSKANKPPVQ